MSLSTMPRAGDRVEHIVVIECCQHDCLRGQRLALHFTQHSKSFPGIRRSSTRMSGRRRRNRLQRLRKRKCKPGPENPARSRTAASALENDGMVVGPDGSSSAILLIRTFGAAKDIARPGR
jgi:hypothetical protein